jgi:hypothetical protein
MSLNLSASSNWTDEKKQSWFTSAYCQCMECGTTERHGVTPLPSSIPVWCDWW